jgi:DNA-binding MarR family transcriptional regulator
VEPALTPLEDCVPDRCPCDDKSCTLSRYVRAAGTGPLSVDAMATAQNVNRAAGAMRRSFERSVLAPHALTWSGWEVLWVGWVWGEVETRHLAYEAGMSKATLTGVLRTLERRGLVQRRTHPADARRVLVTLTGPGRDLMTDLLPQVNAEEARLTSMLSPTEATALFRSLRKVVVGLETDGQGEP